MSKAYVIGDLHGNYKGLIQAIDRSPFKVHEDTLISLGDLIDGGPDSCEVIEFLSNLPKCILIKGNHDEWFKNWLLFGVNPVAWLQGQHHTAKSYIKYVKEKTGEDRFLIPDHGGYKCNLTYFDIPEKHITFLNSGVNYYIDDNNNCYVHGGFNRHLKINEQHFDHIYYWDRDLWMQALSYKAAKDPTGSLKFKMKDKFNSIFIGHTTTSNWGKTEPMNAVNIWNLDTGAGFNGKVTIMDVKTKEYWQSDTVKELYGSDFSR